MDPTQIDWELKELIAKRMDGDDSLELLGRIRHLQALRRNGLFPGKLLTGRRRTV